MGKTVFTYRPAQRRLTLVQVATLERCHLGEECRLVRVVPRLVAPKAHGTRDEAPKKRQDRQHQRKVKYVATKNHHHQGFMALVPP